MDFALGCDSISSTVRSRSFVDRTNLPRFLRSCAIACLSTLIFALVKRCDGTSNHSRAGDIVIKINEDKLISYYNLTRIHEKGIS